jgi:hypothetical protein
MLVDGLSQVLTLDMVGYQVIRASIVGKLICWNDVRVFESFL